MSSQQYSQPQPGHGEGYLGPAFQKAKHIIKMEKCKMLTDNFAAVSVEALFLARDRMTERVTSLLLHKNCSEVCGHRCSLRWQGYTPKS